MNRTTIAANVAIWGLLGLAIYSWLAPAENFPTCVLDHLAGAQTEAAVIANMQQCKARYPHGWSDGRGTGGSYASALECAAVESKKTRNAAAARLMVAACRALYTTQGELFPQ